MIRNKIFLFGFIHMFMIFKVIYREIIITPLRSRYWINKRRIFYFNLSNTNNINIMTSCYHRIWYNHEKIAYHKVQLMNMSRGKFMVRLRGRLLRRRASACLISRGLVSATCVPTYTRYGQVTKGKRGLKINLAAFMFADNPDFIKISNQED